MAYGKYNRDRKPRDEYDPTKVETAQRKQAGGPTEGKTSDQSDFVKKTFKGLALGQSITPKANPYQEAAASSEPYPIIAENNKIIDLGYGDKVNLSGNILTQVLNSVTSKALNAFDMAKINVEFNYRHISTGITAQSAKRRAYNREMQKAFDEAVSKGYAETFTTLPVFSWTWTAIGTPGITGPLAGVLAYQQYLQDIALVVNGYNKLLAMEKHLKMMSFNREEPILNQIWFIQKECIQITHEYSCSDN